MLIALALADEEQVPLLGLFLRDGRAGQCPGSGTSIRMSPHESHQRPPRDSVELPRADSPPARWHQLGVDQLAHELGRELGVLMGVADVDRLAVHDRQLVAELVADVALIADLSSWPGRSRGNTSLVSSPTTPSLRS